MGVRLFVGVLCLAGGGHVAQPGGGDDRGHGGDHRLLERRLRVLGPREFAALQDGDTFVDGRLIDAHGREVPHATSQEQYEALRARIECGELSSVDEIRDACRGA